MWEGYQYHEPERHHHHHSNRMLSDSEESLRTPSPTYHYSFHAEQTSASSAQRRNDASRMDPYTMLHFLNRDIVASGLPGPLRLPEHDEYLEDNQRIVECLTALLVQRQKDLDFRHDMDDEMRRAMGEEESQNFKISQLKKQLEASQREAADLNSKVLSLQKVNVELEARHKKAISELRAIRTGYESAKVQFQHDLKKRDQESARLKQRIQKAIGEKFRASKIAFNVLNPNNKQLGLLHTADGPSTERKLLNDLLTKYEDNEKQLIHALEQYKSQMARIRRELRQVTQSQEHGGPGDEVEEPEIGDLDGFTVGVSELIVTLSNYIDKLRARSEVKADPEEIAARDKHIAELEAKIEGLEKELIALKSKVGQQNHVLDVVTSADFIKGSAENALNASISEMTLEEMEIERKALKREKEQLEEERKRFTEAAIELGNERKVLKKEREAFESHKVHSATHQVLSALPDTPQWLKNADVNQDASTPQLYSKLQDLMLATPLGALYTAQMNTLLRHQALQQSPATAAIFQSPLSQNGSAPARASETPLLATAKDEGPSPFHDVATQESPPEDAHDNPDTAKQHHEQPPPPLLHSPRKSDKGQSNDGGRGSAADGTPGSAPRLITAERARIAVLRKGPDSAGGSPRAESRRTPLEIRQGRAGRLCTRPGCAAHSPHTHEDENGNVRPMELKPPVPRFRKAAASPPASPAFAPRTSSRLGVSSGTAPAQLQSKRPTSVLARYASMADRRDPISRSKTPLLRSPTSRQNLEAATKD